MTTRAHKYKKDPAYFLELFFTDKHENVKDTIAGLGLMFPHFCQAMAATIMRNKQCGLEEAIKTVRKAFLPADNLHNNKGVPERIVEKLKDNERLDKKMLKEQIALVLKRSNPSMLDGKKWLEFVVKFEDILFQKGVLKMKPNVQSISQQLKEFLHRFRFITWISNQPKGVDEHKGIILWLYHLTFEMGEIIFNLPQEFNFGCLYLHMVLTEYPRFMQRHGSLAEQSTQSFEASIATLKRTLKYKTNRRIKEAVVTMMQMDYWKRARISKISPKSLFVNHQEPEKCFVDFRNTLQEVKDISYEIPAEGRGKEIFEAFTKDMTEMFPNLVEINGKAVTLLISKDLGVYLEHRYSNKNK